MKRMFYRRGGWVPLLLLVLACLIATPVSAANQSGQQRRATTTNLNASVYLATESLKSVFQDQINQQVSNLSGSMMNKMLGNLPAADQGWARGMAGALIQPSATLTQLTPQNDGLDTKLSLSLYPGDPKPTNAEMLVTFSVRDPSTIQVSAQPVAGSPELVNGPLTTFAVPVGQLQSINTTPGCGNAGLKVNIQMPVTLNMASNQSQNNQVAQSALPNNQILADIQQPQVSYTTQNRAANALDAYAEIPNSSLSALGSAIGTIKIDNVLTARNLRINTQADNTLAITSDINAGVLWVATAVTTVQPSAENGQLVMHVTSTIIHAGPFFTFPNNTYNQKIENMLNSNLGNALAGKFTVNGVSVGGGTALSCADSSSLILQGTTNLG